MADTEPTRTVAIAIDQSEYFRHALEFYLENIHSSRFELVLIAIFKPLHDLNCIPASGYTMGAMAALPSSHWQQMAAEQKEKIRQLKTKLEPLFEGKSIPRHWRVIETTAAPGEAIVATANEVGASLIVVGSRGQGAVRRTILGSVSDYVLHHAKVPVLVSHGRH
ncbi:universal stress protein Sll1388-like isoform X2 [Lineus longissimus]|uniref:universal stress protein Sll1388-like isoform X2 n=1 Tax=Lineus longissimus TaxID=88925 RepID=UPI002B4C3AC3